ncbi:MAG: hypothetical protein COZ08_07060 [Bacteroidetes bacterium CG_4_10_14_3_um_filter_42_6]|nr:MAG: hypothetical protein COZ08_07060 [Bacteroidetes bacterium CG_4_10_14_3_um_filter_42_6]
MVNRGIVPEPIPSGTNRAVDVPYFTQTIILLGLLHPVGIQTAVLVYGSVKQAVFGVLLMRGLIGK